MKYLVRAEVDLEVEAADQQAAADSAQAALRAAKSREVTVVDVYVAGTAI